MQRKASEHEHVEAGALSQTLSLCSRSFVSPAVFLSDCALGDAQVLARRIYSNRLPTLVGLDDKD